MGLVGVKREKNYLQDLIARILFRYNFHKIINCILFISHYFDLNDKIGKTKFGEFKKLFCPLMKNIKYEDVIFGITKEWRDIKKLKNEQKIYTFILVDELRYLADKEEEDDEENGIEADKGVIGFNAMGYVLDFFKKDVDEVNLAYVLTAIDPRKLNEEIKGVSDDMKTASGRIPLFKFPPLMSDNKMKEIAKEATVKYPTNERDFESDPILLSSIEMTGGHYRTIQYVIKKYNEIINKGNMKLQKTHIEDLLFINFTRGMVSLSENEWKIITPSILQIPVYPMEIITLDKTIKLNKSLIYNNNVFSYIMNGIYLTQIDYDQYAKSKIYHPLVPKVSPLYLYSFSKIIYKAYINKIKVDPKTKTIADLLIAVTENCLKDQVKVFEHFIGSLLLLNLQLRAFLFDPKLTNPETEFQKICSKKTVTVKELFHNNLDTTFLENGEFLELEIELLDDNDVPIFFSIERDNQTGRYLSERFKNQEIKPNILYHSSHKNEPGLESFIIFRLTNKQYLLISNQMKFKYEETKEDIGIESGAPPKLLDATKELLKVIRENPNFKGKIIYSLPIIFSNKHLVSGKKVNHEITNENKKGVAYLIGDRMKGFMSPTFDPFPFGKNFFP